MTKLHKDTLSRNGSDRSLTPLKDCTLVIHRGSIYEPFHRRLTFVEENGDVAYGLALDADGHLILQIEVLVVTTASMAEFEARRALATALHEHFRADTAVEEVTA